LRVGRWMIVLGRGEPEISCLRYGFRPRVSDDIRGGISATIVDMEVDVIFRSLDHHDVTSEDCSRSVVLHNFHLSCALARDSNSSSTTTASTRTICGIVPTLQTGDCVRILASLFVADSRVSTDEHQGTPVTVDISIHGLWADGNYLLMMHKDGQNTAVDNARGVGQYFVYSTCQQRCCSWHLQYRLFLDLGAGYNKR